MKILKILFHLKMITMFIKYLNTRACVRITIHEKFYKTSYLYLRILLSYVFMSYLGLYIHIILCKYLLFIYLHLFMSENKN